MAKRSGPIQPYIIDNWKGLNTSIKDPRYLKPGETYDSLNWLTGRFGDHIELRRGSALLGQTDRNGSKVTGIGVGTRIDGVQVPFFSAERSIYYYNAELDETIASDGDPILPVAADGEDMNYMPYSNLAGSFMFLTSRNSSQYKIPIANPASVVDQFVQTYRFGFAKINRSRMVGVNRKGDLATSFDPTGVYVSWIDKQNYTDYANNIQNNKPQASGDGATKAFSSPTLAGTSFATAPYTLFGFMFAGPIATGTAVTGINQSQQATITSNAHGLVRGDFCYVTGIVAGMTEINGIITSVINVLDANTVQVSIDSSAYTVWSAGGTLYKLEVFNDDRSGNLNSNLGGTGTINYATGAWSLLFNTAPIAGANNIIANFYYEQSTVEGILDFSYNPSTRVPGTGNLFRQDDGGGVAQAVWPFQGVEYCFHTLKSWLLTFESTDVPRDFAKRILGQIGIPYPRALFPTGEGIIFLNNVNPAQPKVSILQIPPGSTNLTVLPTPLSVDLDLSSFAFDYAVVHRWGEYDIMECQKYVNGQKQEFNSVTFVRNIYSGLWNKLDFASTCFGEYYGALLGGSSISPNVQILFSGFDDEGEVIANNWNSGYTDLDIPGLKKANFFNISGLIQPSQRLVVSISIDQGPYAEVYTIDGNGSYVSKNNPVSVGSFTVGSNVVGGGGDVTANPFEIDIPINAGPFEFISFQFQAIDVGYIQVDKAGYKDIRWLRRRINAYNDPQVAG